MTLGITNVDRQDIGDAERIVADVTFDSSYPWKGEPVTAKDLGFRVGALLFSVKAVSQNGKRRLTFLPGGRDTSLVDRGNLRVHGDPGPDFLLNRAGLQIGTGNAAQVRNGNAISKVVGGAIAEVAASETAFTATTHDIAADAGKIQERAYLLSVQAGGTIVITPGAIADENLAEPGAVPASEAPMGTVLIKVAAGATPFDATSDLLTASHLTVTFEDWDEEVIPGTDISGLTMRVVAEGR